MEPSYSYNILKHSALLLIISLLLQAYSSKCCLENEKEALLQLKSSFMSLSISPEYISDELSSWDSKGEGNCCLWDRVRCNDSTQHVTKLSLDALMAYSYEVRTVLNVTLFEPFGELISLDLSSNHIANLVGNGGNKRLSLRSLEILDFGDNKLRLEEVGDLVGSLTSLKTLKLPQNYMGGNFTGKEVAHLEKLEVLDLSRNFLYGGFLLGQEEVAHLKKLRVLHLSSNSLNGSLPEGLCKLRKLEDLRLPGNSLSGDIPKCLWNMTSLLSLDLSLNSFSGNLPTLINLPSLQRLFIHNNYFQGRFSLCHLMNHSRIEHLLLSNNALQVEIEDASCLSSKVASLELANCKLVGQYDLFPKFLSNLSNLEFLDLSSNGLIGLFPLWLLQNNSNLYFLNFRNNSLSGSLVLPMNSTISTLHCLDISYNKFNGEIPEHIGMVLPSLDVLNMSLNSFEGHIPASIGKYPRS